MGPRTKLSKSIGAYASAAGHGSSASQGAASAAPARSDVKALSANCEVEFADIPAERWARLPLSAQEQEIINAGTNEIDMDWRNIRL